MALRKLAIASALVLTAYAAAPAKASADWLFTPYLGMNWGGTAGFTDSLGDFEDEFEQKMNFGASLSWMGAGVGCGGVGITRPASFRVSRKMR